MKLHRIHATHLIALTAAAALLMSIGQSDAAFILQEDFESYTVNAALDGQGNWSADSSYTVADVDASVGSGTTQALRLSGNTNQHKAGLALSNAIADNSIGTLFFQYRIEEGQTPISYADSVSMGASHLLPPLANNVNIQSAYTVVRTNAGTLRARDGGSEVNVVTTLAEDTWHNVWMVLNTTSNTYDVHIASGATVASVTGLDFRYGQNDPIQTFFMMNWNIDFNDGGLYVDNIYVDPTGENLVNPVPEPASLALLGLGGLCMLARRRERR